MENRNVGYLILGISLVLIVIIFIYSSALRDFVDSSCTLTHGGELCPMQESITKQNYLSFSIVGILILIGLILIFSKPQIQERIVVRKVKEKVEVSKKPVDYSKLDKDEKIVVKLLDDSEGGMFQSDIVEKTGISKVKITRILDKLEGRQIIERKRRGMNNFVVLK